MTNIDDLKKLREPFSPSEISKLPKPTRAQTDEVKRDFKSGVRCTICGGWHHPKVVHLDYVGHAALTNRLLTVDPEWQWQPLAVHDSGLPVVDSEGLLWINLTICGVTRLGVGDAGGKTGGDAMKERIGDALRNAGMRFGLALDLWHKGSFEPDEWQSFDKSTAMAEITRIMQARNGPIEPMLEWVAKGSGTEYAALNEVPEEGLKRILKALGV